jgi:glycosyltransferase involved in cell wall biosynthesis
MDFPKISIVTPSFNQGQFLEETIRSIISQGYPSLEYVIIDGGSTDQSVEIIRRYTEHLTYWVSEPDRGQANALNKGFARCSGDILGWINSDDCLLPNALHNIAIAARNAPDAILIGEVINLDDALGYSWLTPQHNITFETMVEPWRHKVFWHQPGIWFPRTLYQQIGILDETLRYCFDREWMCRALQTAPVYYLGQAVAQFRYHRASKTVGDAADWFEELRLVRNRYLPRLRTGIDALAEADFELYVAEKFLWVHNWDRIQGGTHLKTAVRYDWRVMRRRRFWFLVAKAFMPFRILQTLRTGFYLRHVSSHLRG